MPIQHIDGGIRLRVHVQPRASRTEIVGVHGDAIRIRLAAPPVDGAANDELIRFLGEALAVGTRAVEITTGQAARRKTVKVAGVTVERARALLTRRGLRTED